MSTHAKSIVVIAFVLSVASAVADTTNPVLEDPVGSQSTVAGVITRAPDGTGYQLTIETLCPVDTATFPVAVAETLDIVPSLGQERSVTVLVNPGRTFTLTAVNAVPEVAPAECRIPPPLPATTAPSVYLLRIAAAVVAAAVVLGLLVTIAAVGISRLGSQS